MIDYHDAQSMTGVTVVAEAPSPIGGPPPQFYHHDLVNGLRVVQVDARGNVDIIQCHSLRHGWPMSLRSEPTQTSGTTNSRTLNIPNAKAAHAASELSPRWVLLTLEEIDRLSSIADGTDVPNETSIRHARRAIEILSQLNLQPTNVVASAEGGIGIFFVANNKYSDIEFLNSGEVLAIVKNASDGYRNVWEIDPDDLERGVGTIQSFMRDS